MTDETNVQAETQAEGEIIDLDKVEAPEPEKDEGEETEKKEEPEAKAEGEDDKEGDEDKPRKTSGIHRLKARNAALMQELSARERQLEDLQRQSTASDPQDKEPVEADFNGDYFAWQRALTAFDTRKVIREEHRKSTQSNIQSERQTLMRERAEAHMERVEAAKEFITDYDKVIDSSKSIALKPEVAEEILSSEKSELLAYHLAKNPDKLRALNGMTGRELAKEIGRLEGSVRAPSAKTQTSAPPPPSKVNGGSSPASQDSILSNWLKKTYG